MRIFQVVALGLSKVSASAAALILVLMLVYTLLEIVLRMFNRSTFILEEMIGYGVAAVGFLGLGYTLEQNGLVRVRAVLDQLGRQTFARRAAEFVAVTLTLFVTGVAAWSFGVGVFRNYLRGYTSGTLADVPMWIPEGTVLFGLVVFWIQLLSLAVQLLTNRSGLLKSESFTVPGLDFLWKR